MNRPITIAITVAFLVVSSAADAASCKYKVNEVDLFTQQKLVATEWYSMTSAMSSAFKILVNNRTSVSVAAVSEAELKFIAVKLKLNDGAHNKPSNEDLRDAILVEEGSPLTIIFADESEVVLFARKTVRGTTRHGLSGGQGVVESNLVVQYALESGDIDALLGQDVSFMSMAAVGGRFAFVGSNGQIKFEMNRKGRDRFSEALTCLNKS